VGNQRHQTEIVVNSNSSAAEADVDRLIAKYKTLNALARSVSVGGQGAAPGAPMPPGLNPSGAAPAPPPPAPSAAPGGGMGGGGRGAGAPPPLPPPAPSAGDNAPRPALPPVHPRGGAAQPVPAPAPQPQQPTGQPWQPGGVLQWGGLRGAPGALASAYGAGLYGVSPLLQRGSMGAGQMLSGGLNRLGQTRPFQSLGASSKILGALGNAAAALPVGIGAGLSAMAGLGGVSLNQRMGLIGQYQGLERDAYSMQTMSFDARGGKAPVSIGRFFGLSPQASSGILRQAVSSFGGVGAPVGAFAREAFSAEVDGVGAGVFGNWMSLAGLGGGATWGARGGVTGFAQARGAARALGMRGSREAAYISGLAQIGSGRAEAGLMTDMGGLNKFAYNVARGGSGGARGLGGMRAARGMTGLGQRAYGQFTSAFSGLGEAAIMAQALEGGGSPMEIAARLAKSSGDPYAMRDAITGAFGSDSGLALLGAGLSPDLASGILGAGKKGSPSYRVDGKALAAGLPVSRAQAQREASKMAEVMKNPEWAAELIKSQGKIELSLLKLTGEDGIARELLDAVNTSIKMFEDLSVGFNEMVQKARDLF